jgi:hypothetical protein
VSFDIGGFVTQFGQGSGNPGTVGPFTEVTFEVEISLTPPLRGDSCPYTFRIYQYIFGGYTLNWLFPPPPNTPPPTYVPAPGLDGDVPIHETIVTSDRVYISGSDGPGIYNVPGTWIPVKSVDIDISATEEVKASCGGSEQTLGESGWVWKGTVSFLDEPPSTTGGSKQNP